MIIYVSQDSLLVKEYFLFLNDADRTYIGPTPDGNQGTLRFSLPEGATDLQNTIGLMECCMIRNEEGFTDSMPLLPGMKEVAYSYQLSYSSGTYTLPRKVNYPTTEFDLLVKGEGIDVTGDKLTPGEPMDIEGVRYNHLSSGDLAPGDILTVRLSSLSTPNDQETVKWTAIALVLLAFGFFLVKKRFQPASPEESIAQRRQRLLAELASLDDDYEDGKIGEEVYHRLRAEKKAQLFELMQKLKKKSGER